MRQVIALLSVLLLLHLTPAFAAGTHHHLTWSRCVLHLNWDNPHQVNKRVCTTYPIRKHHPKVIGTWKRVDRVSPHVEVVLRFPRFESPQPTVLWSEWASVTGYSWGCGTPNGITKGGHIPTVGTIASNDGRLWHHHVSVPSVGYYGWVDDTGAPLDLFMSSCTATYSITGYRQIYVYP